MPSRNEPTSAAAKADFAAAATAGRRANAMATERRNWIARSTASLIVAGLVLFSVIVVRRDWNSNSQLLAALNTYVAPLNKTLTDTGYLPADWARLDATEQIAETQNIKPEVFTYLDYSMREFAVTSVEPTMVIWSTMYPMVFLRDGRAVGWLEGKRIRVEWMSESGFNVRMKAQEDRYQQWRTSR
jgi:hypothetical protein